MDDPLSFLGAVEPGAKRVTRTGIALVHENEIIYPAAGSEAQAIQALEDNRTRIDVYFPVEIEVRAVGAGRAAPADGGTLERTAAALVGPV